MDWAPVMGPEKYGIAADGPAVEYRHRDPVLGGEQRATGVVWAVRDGAVSIRPLAPHSVDVNPADVKPLSADDVDG
jgi:hypothetical protein